MTAPVLAAPRADTTARGRARFISGLAAGALQIGLGIALWLGLAPPALIPQAATDVLTALDFNPPPPPSPPPPPHQPHRGAEAAAAPANIRSRAAPVVAAPNPLATPPPIAAAPKPADGAQGQSGAALLAGPGSGAGGAGNGTGSGSGGNGDGDGGDGAELIGGRIKDSDYPRGPRDAHVQGTTQTAIAVAANGRATGCRILRSSGSAELDDTTCRLAVQRFRFRPARDRSGHAVADSVDYDQEWTLSGQWDEPPRR